MSEVSYIGIDLGGTNIKAGLVGEGGVLLAQVSVPTEAARGVGHTIARIAEAGQAAIAAAGVDRASVRGVGIGSPGALDPARGIVRDTPYLPGFTNLPLSDLLSRAVGLPVALENDANAAAWGEFQWGAGKDVNSMVLLTLGTGIGSGIIVDGQLLRGSRNAAGELGHQIVRPGGAECGCGQHGCLEAYASARNIARRAADALEAGEQSALAETLEKGGAVECQDMVAAARAGDAMAVQIWDESCYYLAVGCVNAAHYLDPELIVFSGGLAAAGALLTDTVSAHVDRLYWKLDIPRPSIVSGVLGDDAGLIGAAGLARARNS